MGTDLNDTKLRPVIEQIRLKKVGSSLRRRPRVSFQSRTAREHHSYM